MNRTLTLAFTLFSTFGIGMSYGQSIVVPVYTYSAAHFADGQGFTSDIILTNLDSGPHCFSVRFVGNSGYYVAVPLVDYGAVTAARVCLAGLGSQTLKTTGGSSPVLEGWVWLGCDVSVASCTNTGTGAAVTGSVVFRWSRPGLPDFEAAVPFDATASSHLAVPYDNTNGYFSGMAITNPFAGAYTTVTLIFHAENGATIFTATLNMAPAQHMSFVLPSAFPQLAGTRGVMEAVSSSGTEIGLVALRFTPAGPFTTLFPVTSTSW